MRNARTTLAIFAVAAMFGCTVQSPTTTPTRVQVKLQLPATEASFPLTRNLTQRFAHLYDEPRFNVEQRSYEILLQQLNQESISYFTSSHIPARDDLWAAPLAVDGLAIIVSPLNSLNDLQIDDLRDIFAGQIADWSELGGTEIAIAPLTVSESSDTYRELQRMLTGTTGITGNALLAPNFEAMLNTVSEAPGAIGYAPLNMVDSNVKVLAIDGVLPSPDSVSKQLYPLRSTIYIIGRKEPPPPYRNLIGWVQSDAGQAVVAESHATLP